MSQDYTLGKGQSLQKVVLGAPDSPMQKGETRPFYTRHKILLGVGERLECKTQNHDVPRRTLSGELDNCSWRYLRFDSKIRQK